MKINESQLRQIVRESLQEYLMGEEGNGQMKEITISDLTIKRIKFMGDNGSLYRFEAQTGKIYCEWETKEEYGDMMITNGIIEGTVDLSQIQGAIDKKQKIQRQWIEKYFKQALGFFDVYGIIPSLDETTLVFSEENNMEVMTEDETNIINVTKITLNTTGLEVESDDEYEYDDEYDNAEEVGDQTEVGDENPLSAALRKAGFTFEEDGDKGKIRTANDNQWVATYYSGDNAVMTFPDFANAAFVSNLKAACANANVHFIEQ